MNWDILILYHIVDLNYMIYIHQVHFFFVFFFLKNPLSSRKHRINLSKKLFLIIYLFKKIF